MPQRPLSPSDPRFVCAKHWPSLCISIHVLSTPPHARTHRFPIGMVQNRWQECVPNRLEPIRVAVVVSHFTWFVHSTPFELSQVPAIDLFSPTTHSHSGSIELTFATTTRSDQSVIMIGVLITGPLRARGTVCSMEQIPCHLARMHERSIARFVHLAGSHRIYNLHNCISL